MKDKEIIFYDDTDIGDKYDLMCCFLFDTEAKQYGWETQEDIPEEYVWDNVNEQSRTEYEDFCYELEKFLENGYFIVTGKCGRWDGTFDGGSFIQNLNDLMEMLQHLDNIKFYEVKGHFYITGYHHDGTDYYELKKLTKVGIKYAERNNFAHDRTLHKNIMTNNLYSRLPRFAKVVYGV